MRRFFEVPLAFISTPEGDLERLISRHGIEVDSLPAASGPTVAVLGSGGRLIVSDARRDLRLRQHWLVTGPPGVRFFAGQALHSPSGEAIGILAIADREVRQMPDDYVSDLAVFAGMIELQMAGGADQGDGRRLPETAPPRPPEPLAAPLSEEGMAAELERATRVNAALVRALTQDLRSVVTGIHGFSEMSRDQRLDRHEIQDFADEINRGARQIDAIIADLLDLQRLSIREHQIAFAMVDPAHLVRECRDQVARESPGHLVEAFCEPGLAQIVGDADILRSALLSLLRNAVKYTPIGSQVEVRLAQTGDLVEFTVVDHGPGMTAAELQGALTWSGLRSERDPSHVRGTGLPLPAIAEVARLHRGQAWAETAPGSGFSFHLELPLSQEPA
ncbi:MAG TPA: HAMP domain-containing sensor histidine kinase [Candidatus Nitrosotalea sp.]|nr:HAMP domain-containing sensor histidine kinase [Candidatus Nitrosotalea sp.]